MSHYLHSTAPFGFAVGFGYYDDRSGSQQGKEGLFQTEKERSVTVINVLAETETVGSSGPVVTVSIERHDGGLHRPTLRLSLITIM